MIVKVHRSENILNEEFSSIFGMSYDNYDTPGFSVELRPLNFSMEQRGNTPLEHPKFKYNNGDVVIGMSPYDNKQHEGMIVNIWWDGSDKDFPKYVYIQDKDTNALFPLQAKTIKKKHDIDDDAPYEESLSYFDRNPQAVSHMYANGIMY